MVNYEIVDYDTTDVIGAAEDLPFRSEVFDGVISVAVLEHVKDPFRSSRELIRVLKPGGTLICAVPFLQPVHGYPHHYFNMTRDGLRTLFEEDAEVERHVVPPAMHPVYALSWILNSWADGLEPETRDRFAAMSVSQLMDDPAELAMSDFAVGLSLEKCFELAAGTMIVCRKLPASES